MMMLHAGGRVRMEVIFSIALRMAPRGLPLRLPLLDGCPGCRFRPAAYTLTGLPYERSRQCLLSWSAMDCWQRGAD